MKLLIASDPYGNQEAIQAHLMAAGIQADSLTFVESAKALLETLIKNTYDFIITEYSVNGTDIWRLSKLINSTHLKLHSCPLYLIQETCEIEIPLILAKEYVFSVVSLDDLAVTLEAAHHLIHDPDCEHPIPAKNTLLIIEDDEDAALTAYHALKEIYDIDRARDGLSGYELWENKRHDLVLLDLMLPKVSGEQILEQMMTVNKNQSVIIVTALDKPHVHNKLLLNGASEYLCKPFSLVDLKALCQMLLNKSKLLHQAHYAESRVNTLRNLVWLLDYALTCHETEKVQGIMKSLKSILPNNLTEDEKISLLTREF